LRGKFFERKRDAQAPESAELAPDLDAIKKEACSYYRVEPSKLLKSRRGSFNEPRSMAMYLARILRKDSLMDIGAEFGLSGYSSVSSVLQGIGKQMLKNRRLQERYNILKKALIIGQTET
jgi:chromosomal replication initiation ATPase DnaA